MRFFKVRLLSTYMHIAHTLIALAHTLIALAHTLIALAHPNSTEKLHRLYYTRLHCTLYQSMNRIYLFTNYYAIQICLA